MRKFSSQKLDAGGIHGLCLPSHLSQLGISDVGKTGCKAFAFHGVSSGTASISNSDGLASYSSVYVL
jgi:hypothetical protein